MPSACAGKAPDWLIAPEPDEARRPKQEHGADPAEGEAEQIAFRLSIGLLTTRPTRARIVHGGGMSNRR